MRRSIAPARAKARETARIALAPNRDLLAVPSNSTIARSRSSCVSNDRSLNDSFKVPLTFAVAFRQPRPSYRSASPSRSSSASAAPVEAPEGTEADPTAPPSSSQTAFTVGRPRLSRISNPLRRDILGMPLQPPHEVFDQPWHTLRRVVYELEHRLPLVDKLLLVQVLQRGAPGDACQ